MQRLIQTENLFSILGNVTLNNARFLTKNNVA